MARADLPPRQIMAMTNPTLGFARLWQAKIAESRFQVQAKRAGETAKNLPDA